MEIRRLSVEQSTGRHLLGGGGQSAKNQIRNVRQSARAVFFDD